MTPSPLTCDNLPCEPVWLNPAYSPVEVIESAWSYWQEEPLPIILQQLGKQHHILGYYKDTRKGVVEIIAPAVAVTA